MVHFFPLTRLLSCRGKVALPVALLAFVIAHWKDKRMRPEGSVGSTYAGNAGRGSPCTVKAAKTAFETCSGSRRDGPSSLLLLLFTLYSFCSVLFLKY